MTSHVIYKGNLSTQAKHLKSSSLIETDAPVDNHGTGSNFSPTDLVATSLASCMITVMGIKAKANNISFENVEASILKIMDSNPRRISEIQINFTINEQWNEKETKIMERTAHTCPVAKSLHPDLVQNIIFNYQ